jgi:HAD superfamily hydrolase (TIGR01509 family)
VLSAFSVLPNESPTPKYKAILFDLDGTLIEFKFDVKASRQAMIGWLRQHHFDVSGISDDYKTQAIFKYIKQLFDSNRTFNMSYGEIIHELDLILEKFEFDAFKVARPHPGSLALLKHLKEKQLVTGLVTNSGRKPVNSILEPFGFLPYLSIIVTRDEVQNLKPHPEGIQKALSQLGLSASETLYVGDSIIDIQASKSAGVRCAGLSTGLYDYETLSKANPDYIVRRIEEVKSILAV